MFKIPSIHVTLASLIVIALPAHAQSPVGGRVAAVDGSAPCQGGILKATDGTRVPLSLGRVGIDIKSLNIVSAVSVITSTCRGKVARTVPGGVVLDTGEEFSVYAGHVHFWGSGATLNVVKPTCSFEAPKAVQCISMISIPTSVLTLTKSPRGHVVEIISGKTRRIVMSASRGANIKGIAYLPAPDAAGGIITAYIESRTVGYLVSLNSAI